MDVAIISPVSPLQPLDGHSLAVLSDVNAILDNKLRLGVIAFTYGDETNTVSIDGPTKFIPARAGGAVSRFLRGMVKRLPPSAERLYTSRAYRDVRETLLAWAPRTVIIDDASVAGYISLVRHILPRAQVILRSHNVMHDVRLAQLQRSKGPLRPLIQFDCERYIEFERAAVQMADAHWAITSADAARMTELYQRPADCLTVSLPLERYTCLRTDQGRSNAFVHVGTIDIRRRSDLSGFLNVDWPKVLHADPSATLTLAGTVRGSTITARNVTYSGRVPSDTDVYRLGRFAFNFQSSTGGVKLKTLTSFAAGRTLVSTAQGIEGLPLESGKHYWNLDTFLSSPQLKDILEDVRATQPIADAGRSYVLSNHSRATLARQFWKLFEVVQRH